MQKRKIYPLPEHACKTNHTDAIIGINLKLSPPTVGTVEPRLSGFLDYPNFFSGPNLVMSISVLVTIKIRCPF